MILFSEILIWPKPEPSDYVWLFFFFLLVGLSYFAIQHLFKKQKKSIEADSFILSELIGRGFQPEEANVLKNFYQWLNEEKKQILAETRNWKFLKKELYDYLIESKVHPNLAIQIYKKLFTQGFPKSKEFNISDIEQGELIALITEYGEEIVRVAKTNDKDFLLSARKPFLPTSIRNIPAKIYVYKVPLGGYYIKGTVIGALEDAILFHAESAPEHIGHAHLMLEEKFEVQIENWPKKDILIEKTEKEPETTSEVHAKIHNLTENEDKKLEEEIMSLEEEIRRRFSKPKPDSKIEVKKEQHSHTSPNLDKKIAEVQNIEFVCQGLKISDRGLVFELPEGINPNFWKNSELWKLNFQLPKGKFIETKAKILPSSKYRSRYIAKFIDMSDSLRLEIYDHIKNFGGEREVLN